MTQAESGGPAGRDALVTSQRRVGLVWLIPIVAILIGAYLAYDAISSRGPTITITFETAEGLTEGKTKLQYRNVDVGTVDSIAISDNVSFDPTFWLSIRHDAETLWERGDHDVADLL